MIFDHIAALVAVGEPETLEFKAMAGICCEVARTVCAFPEPARRASAVQGAAAQTDNGQSSGGRFGSASIWSKAAMTNEGDLVRLWKMFHHDVTKVTFQLFTLLHGSELVYNKELPLYNRGRPEARKWGIPYLSGPSYLDLYPTVLGTDILNILGRGGEVEQLAYRAWVVEIYRLLEERYRKQIEEAFRTDGVRDTIPPVLPVMGDFRHIRNDLVHGDGKASEEETGKCEVLEWFQSGDQIVLSVSHVLDFIHHLGCFGFNIIHTGSELSRWRFGTNDMLLSRQPVPKIVSVRTDLEVHPDSEEIWFLISLVYDNGFFSHHASPTGVKNSDDAWAQMRQLINEAKITPEGDLDGPVSWLRAKAQDIYPRAVETYARFLKGENKQDFPKEGFPGPWIKFRNAP